MANDNSGVRDEPKDFAEQLDKVCGTVSEIG
jgi:hypothetical protein